MLLSLFGGAFAAADHHFPPALCRAHISMRRIVAQFVVRYLLCVCHFVPFATILLSG